nr:MAG TPA: hypothetical protein [Caudoviricetes sp.]
MGYLDNTGLAYLWGKIRAKLVQPDWQQNDQTAPDYVKNRPGGYDVPEYVITWDGVIGNRLTVPVDETMQFVKVSGRSPGIANINGSLVYANVSSPETISDVTSSNVVFNNAIAFVSTPGWGNGEVTFPESGIYFGRRTIGTLTVFITRLEVDLTPVKIPQKYLDLDSKANKSIDITATLLASGWMGENAPYIYNLSVTGVTGTSNQEYLPALGITTEQLEALQGANIQDDGQAEGTVTLKAFGTKPSIDLPIRIILRGD